MSSDGFASARTVVVSGFVSRAAAAVGRFIAERRRRRDLARAERQLREMPDRSLKDIGMHRSEIPAMVRFGRAEYGG